MLEVMNLSGHNSARLKYRLARVGSEACFLRLKTGCAMNCPAERQVRCSTLGKVICTEMTFNVLCFDFLRLHRNEVINCNNVVNKVIAILNDDC
jgi:hypothetical protein